MHLDLPAPFIAALTDLQPWMIAMIIPIVALIAGGATAISALFFNHRRKEMWHETARIALEKGQPLPAMPSENEAPGDPKSETANDLRGGLVLIGTGIGLFAFLNNFIGVGIAYVGAIPGFIGLALLISGSVRFIFSRKDSGKSGRSSQS